jgi:hypothetical protein
MSMIDFNCPECGNGLKLDIDDPSPPKSTRSLVIILGTVCACLALWAVVASFVAASRSNVIRTLRYQLYNAEKDTAQANHPSPTKPSTPPTPEPKPQPEPEREPPAPQEPPLYSENLPSSEAITAMDLDTRVKWARKPPAFPKEFRNPHELQQFASERERFRGELNDGLMKLQSSTVLEARSKEWWWPERHHTARIKEVRGLVVEVREKGVAESFFDMFADEPVDWLVLRLRDPNRKSTFTVYYPPRERARIVQLKKDELLECGPCIAISSGSYVPETYWSQFKP